MAQKSNMIYREQYDENGARVLYLPCPANEKEQTNMTKETSKTDNLKSVERYAPKTKYDARPGFEAPWTYDYAPPKITDSLLDVLTYMRPMGSHGEAALIRDYIAPLSVAIDGCGNLFKRIGDAPILWSSHTDTVHKHSGRQTIRCEHGVARLSNRSRKGKGDTPRATCLGADDGVGIWIMAQMIARDIPGLYVFHYGEERGGIGSAFIADHTPDILDGIQMAIAFDRAGYNDVITHQGFERCCSDVFADDLAERLGMDFVADDTGVFTDTANYTSLIPECTNLSVGYFNQHGGNETQDLHFAAKLLDAICAIDFSTLPIERDPADCEYDQLYGYSRGWESASDYEDVKYFNLSPSNSAARSASIWDERRDDGEKLADLVRDYPSMAVAMLQDCGITAEELAELIYQRTGNVPY